MAAGAARPSCYRELYLPQEWRRTGCGGRKPVCRWGGLPHQSTTGRPEMIGRAVAAGVPLRLGNWGYGAAMTDDCGGGWRNRSRCYDVAVQNNEPLWADTEVARRLVAARRLAEPATR